MAEHSSPSELRQPEPKGPWSSRARFGRKWCLVVFGLVIAVSGLPYGLGRLSDAADPLMIAGVHDGVGYQVVPAAARHRRPLRTGPGTEVPPAVTHTPGNESATEERRAYRRSCRGLAFRRACQASARSGS
ncbi:hypothetical protein GTX07_04720 [Streptomyces sp. SID5606]|nr:hypothetical protein [Streptomyces sp. SID5606]